MDFLGLRTLTPDARIDLDPDATCAVKSRPQTRR